MMIRKTDVLLSPWHLSERHHFVLAQRLPARQMNILVSIVIDALRAACQGIIVFKRLKWFDMIIQRSS